MAGTENGEESGRLVFPENTRLNEAINFERRCIFVAIPKTGTNSVRAQLNSHRRYDHRHQHLDILQVRRLLRTHMMLDGLGRNTDIFTGHVPSDAELVARADRLFEAFFKFSAVRNPWARAVSLYFRDERLRPADTMSFAEFCEGHRYASDACAWPSRHVCQADWLADEQGRSMMDYVYKVEEFASATGALRELSGGRIDLEDRQLNANPQSRAADYRDMYDDHTRKLVARRFERDIDLFGYVF